MALKDLWNSSRDQIENKRIAQLIAFAGEGKLLDLSDASIELRELLSIVPSELLTNWINECLEDRFGDFGLVLQDIVNEIGQRLGFQVLPGVYRGNGQERHDGLWLVQDGSAILVECKSSVAYSINLEKIANYRKQIALDRNIDVDSISILIVVGAEQTDDLEAQVRGSRFAWDVRLLGLRSLVRLLQLKETLDDPAVEKQIREILVPQEFTRLDRIIDLVFDTTEDAQDEAPEESVPDLNGERKHPANFHAAILPQLEKHFQSALIRRSRVIWMSPDEKLLVSCQVSKEFERTDSHYWFGLKRTTQEIIATHQNAYCAFGLGSPEQVVLLPYDIIAENLKHFHTSPDQSGGIRHWHVRFVRQDGEIMLLLDKMAAQLDVTEYLLSNPTQHRSLNKIAVGN